MTKPKCRPLLLKPWEVPPLLSGAKTLIARPVKNPGDPIRNIRCPFGGPGDSLWIQETWKPWVRIGTADEIGGEGIVYRVDESKRECELPPGLWTIETANRWRPGTQMPRWASRLTLAVESGECKQVQDINENDAAFAGMTADGTNCYGPSCPTDPVSSCILHGCWGPREDFQRQWDTDYKDYPFSSNPWVWLGTVRVNEGEANNAS